MAKLYFRYATMNSGKSVDLIRTAYNYEENGYKILILKPVIDTKDGDNVSSRIGLNKKIDFFILKNDSLFEILQGKLEGIACILIDEAQFLSKEQVNELFLISKICDIAVICYGLRLNFKMESFEGSQRLLEIADRLEEFKTLCSCGKIARYVGRKVNGKYVTMGEEIVIDGTANVEYIPMCGDCYLKKVRKLNFKKINDEIRKE